MPNWRARCDYALHLGLTEAGMGSKGIVASVGRHGRAAATGHRRHHPHLADARAERRPHARGAGAQELLQTMGLRTFVPLVAACPGCGRTTSTTFQELAQDIQGFIRDSMPAWKTRYPGRRDAQRRGHGLHRQRPGRESSTPTSASRCPAPARRRPRRCSSTARRPRRLRGPTLSADFKQMVIDYIERRFGRGRGEDGGGVALACRPREGGDPVHTDSPMITGCPLSRA